MCCTHADATLNTKISTAHPCKIDCVRHNRARVAAYNFLQPSAGVDGLMKYRFVVIGDMHLSAPEVPLWRCAIEDINRLEPDAVLSLGDLTAGVDTGSTRALSRSIEMLNHLTAPWHAIIGNHDMQNTDFATDEAAVEEILRQFGRKTPWFSHDFGPLTIIGLSNTQFRQNTVNHEIVYNDQQLQWLSGELERLADRPVLILGHTPPIGSGLVMLSEMHCQGGNAIANQNHTPNKVQRVIHEHPNVLFWFSGHIHLGHVYRDAISIRQGVMYVHTGTLSRMQSRDGHRHSRVLDIEDHAITIRTFDHAARTFDDALEYREPYGLGDFLAYRNAIKGRLFVPRDPKTMRQGPGDWRAAGATRIALLCNWQAMATSDENAQRLVDNYQVLLRRDMPDRVIVWGNPDKPANVDGQAAFLEHYAAIRPIDYLMDNDEPAVDLLDPAHNPNLHPISGFHQADESTGGQVLLLGAGYDNPDALKQLADQWPASGNVLILCPCASEQAIQIIDKLLDKNPDQTVHWVCDRAASIPSNKRLLMHRCDSSAATTAAQRWLIDWNGEEVRIESTTLNGGIKPPMI